MLLTCGHFQNRWNGQISIQLEPNAATPNILSCFPRQWRNEGGGAICAAPGGTSWRSVFLAITILKTLTYS